MSICNPFSKQYHACTDLLRTIKEKDDLVNGIATPKTKTTEKIKAFVIAVFIVIASVIVAIPTLLFGGVALFRTLVGRLVYKSDVNFSDKSRYSVNFHDERLAGFGSAGPFVQDPEHVIYTMHTSINNSQYNYSFKSHVSSELNNTKDIYLNNNNIEKKCGQTLIYKGSLSDGMYNSGKETHKNGDVYEGHFNNSFRDGQGNYTTKNGVVYNCEWVAGHPVKGTETLSNGTVRQGSFVNGLLEGEGSLTLSGGNPEKGTFTKGLFRADIP